MTITKKYDLSEKKLFKAIKAIEEFKQTLSGPREKLEIEIIKALLSDVGQAEWCAKKIFVKGVIADNLKSSERDTPNYTHFSNALNSIVGELK